MCLNKSGTNFKKPMSREDQVDEVVASFFFEILKMLTIETKNLVTKSIQPVIDKTMCRKINYDYLRDSQSFFTTKNIVCVICYLLDVNKLVWKIVVFFCVPSTKLFGFLSMWLKKYIVTVGILEKLMIGPKYIVYPNDLNIWNLGAKIANFYNTSYIKFAGIKIFFVISVIFR